MLFCFSLFIFSVSKLYSIPKKHCKNTLKLVLSYRVAQRVMCERILSEFEWLITLEIQQNPGQYDGELTGASPLSPDSLNALALKKIIFSTTYFF